MHIKIANCRHGHIFLCRHCFRSNWPALRVPAWLVSPTLYKSCLFFVFLKNNLIGKNIKNTGFVVSNLVVGSGEQDSWDKRKKNWKSQNSMNSGIRRIFYFSFSFVHLECQIWYQCLWGRWRIWDFYTGLSIICQENCNRREWSCDPRKWCICSCGLSSTKKSKFATKRGHLNIRY